MRNAEDFVREYRKRGYTDERIRVIANLTREPLRGEVLSILDSGREIDLGDSAPAEEQVKPQPAVKDPVPVVAQEAAASPPAPAKPKPEIKAITPPVETAAPVAAPAPLVQAAPIAAARDETAAELKKATSQLTQLQREKARLEKDLDEQKSLVAEFKKGAERVAVITRQLDEARHDVDQAREQESEKTVALDSAMKELHEAQAKSDELAEKIAQSESTIAALQDRFAQQEKQLKETRVRAEQESAKLRKDSEMEVRNMRRRAVTYKKAAVGAAVAAALMLAVALIMSHNRVGRLPAPPSREPNTASVVLPHSAAPTTNVTSPAPAVHSPDGVQMVSATTFTDSSSAGSAPPPLPAGAIVSGLTGQGSEAPLPAESMTKPVPVSTKAKVNTLQGSVPPPAQQNASGSTYTVKKNDSLWKIAKEQLGDANLAAAIAKENNIPVKTTLKIGQQLKLPAKSVAHSTTM